ncbi:MAG: iron ABC transporter permease [Selenomonadaceae bacterium]|nr:iron ABC transporter permease [Selenomonadaceae bacterium]
MDSKKLYFRASLLTIFLLASMITAICFGSIEIELGNVTDEVTNFLRGQRTDSPNSMIIFDIRIPRILFAAISGAILSLTGMLMQTVSQNYLADPYILGVSSGAGMGAVFCIITGVAQIFAPYGVYVGAFLGAALATVIVVHIAGTSNSPIKLVLIGMGISALFSAFTMLEIYGSKNEAQVRSAMFWLMGSFTGIQWTMIPIAATVLAVLMIFIWLFRHELDLILLGREEAQHLGLSTERMQQAVVLISSMAVAVTVSIAGIIGFIGLVIPHIARFIGESRHAVMLWFTSLIGAVVMVWADVMARSMFAPEEVPIGILTACLGAPVFMQIINRQYKDS